MTPTKAGTAATPSEGEHLADDQVIDACVRAWLGPIALLTIGLRVVVASVQEDHGRRYSKARAVRTTLPVPQLGAAPKRSAASKQAARNAGGPRRRGHNDGAFRSAVARLTARARWFN
jgi:hypothetical protein